MLILGKMTIRMATVDKNFKEKAEMLVEYI